MYTFVVAVIGGSSVGKTSLINVLTTGELVVPTPTPSTEQLFKNNTFHQMKVDGKRVELYLLDSEGRSHIGELPEVADAYLLVTDKREKSVQVIHDLTKWIQAKVESQPQLFLLVNTHKNGRDRDGVLPEIPVYNDLYSVQRINFKEKSEVLNCFETISRALIKHRVSEPSGSKGLRGIKKRVSNTALKIIEAPFKAIKKMRSQPRVRTPSLPMQEPPELEDHTSHFLDVPHTSNNDPKRSSSFHDRHNSDNQDLEPDIVRFPPRYEWQHVLHARLDSFRRERSQSRILQTADEVRNAISLIGTQIKIASERPEVRLKLPTEERARFIRATTFLASAGKNKHTREAKTTWDDGQSPQHDVGFRADDKIMATEDVTLQDLITCLHFEAIICEHTDIQCTLCWTAAEYGLNEYDFLNVVQDIYTVGTDDEDQFLTSALLHSNRVIGKHWHGTFEKVPKPPIPLDMPSLELDPEEARVIDVPFIRNFASALRGENHGPRPKPFPASEIHIR